MRSTFMFRLPAYARSLRCSGPGQLLQIWTTSAATACCPSAEQVKNPQERMGRRLVRPTVTCAAFLTLTRTPQISNNGINVWSHLHACCVPHSATLRDPLQHLLQDDSSCNALQVCCGTIAAPQWVL